MDSIVLIGPQGSGKTLVGEELEKILGIKRIDVDQIFEESHGKISNFKDNMSEFRRLEAELIDAICFDYRSEPIILTPGGGAVAHNITKYREMNTANLRNFGKVFYLMPFPILKESSEVLLKRVENDPNTPSQRPVILCNEKILEVRHPFYREVANGATYTRYNSPRDVAEHILTKINLSHSLVF